MKLTSRMTGIVFISCGLLLFSVWLLFFRLPANYSALPINGRVVDSDSGKPLAGAIVIAVWELERSFGLEGSIPAGFISVSEVLTDEQGRYHIPGWGPLVRREGTYLGHNSPRLTIHKDGYEFFGRGNYPGVSINDNRREGLQRSKWDGETIRLERHEGGYRKLASVLQGVSLNLDVIFNPVFGARQCDWLHIPRIVSELDRHDQILTEQGISTILIPDLAHLNRDKRCTNEAERFPDMMDGG